MKKYLIIVLFFILPSWLLAQNWASSFGKGNAMYQQQNYKGAISELLIARKAAQTEYGEDHDNYRMTVKLLADNYLALQQYANASTYLLELEKLLKKGRKEGTEEYIELQESLAHTYLAGKRIGDAVERFQAALELRKKQDPKSEAYAKNLHELAKLFAQAKKNDQANDYYRELYPLAKVVYKSNPEAYMAIVKESADLQSSMGKPKDAIPLYQEYIKLATGKEAQVEPMLEAYQRIAQGYQATAENQKAVQAWNAYLSALGKNVGEKEVIFQTESERIIGIFRQMKEFVAAEELVNQKIQKLKTNFGAESQEYAVGLVELAQSQKNANQIEEAAKNINQAAEILGKDEFKETEAFAYCLEVHARVLELKGDNELARQKYNQAIGIREIANGPESQKYTASLDMLGQFLLRQKDFAPADSIFSSAMEIRVKNPGKRHPDYAASLQNKAQLYTLTDTLELVEPLLNEASNILRVYYGAGSLEFTQSVSELGDMYLLWGKEAEALKKYTQVLTLLESVRSDDKKDLEASTLQKIKKIKEPEKDSGK